MTSDEYSRARTWLESMYAEDNDRLRAQRDAHLYMWGALSAEAARSPRIRAAMFTAIRLAEEAGYLDAEQATDHRATIDDWRDKRRIITTPDRGH